MFYLFVFLYQSIDQIHSPLIYSILHLKHIAKHNQHFRIQGDRKKGPWEINWAFSVQIIANFSFFCAGFHKKIQQNCIFSMKCQIFLENLDFRSTFLLHFVKCSWEENWHHLDKIYL